MDPNIVPPAFLPARRQEYPRYSGQVDSLHFTGGFSVDGSDRRISAIAGSFCSCVPFAPNRRGKRETNPPFFVEMPGKTPGNNAQTSRSLREGRNALSNQV